jgi:dihydrofolate reductase
MRKLVVFNMVSLDGYFVDASGDMSWAHKHDEEWNTFVGGNASGNGMLLFGRVTYDMMAGYWPSPMALQNSPVVAKGMNAMPKIVFSRTLDKASWNNTTLLKGDVVTEVAGSLPENIHLIIHG